MMHRKNTSTRQDYIKTRIAQLTDDMNKAHDDHDKNWYNRLIQELNWVKNQHHNCYIEENISSDAIRSNMNNF